MFADLKTDGNAFARYPVNSSKEREAFAALVTSTVAAAITDR
jgi:hypothetical protein